MTRKKKVSRGNPQKHIGVDIETPVGAVTLSPVDEFSSQQTMGDWYEAQTAYVNAAAAKALDEYYGR